MPFDKFIHSQPSPHLKTCSPAFSKSNTLLEMAPKAAPKTHIPSIESGAASTTAFVMSKLSLSNTPVRNAEPVTHLPGGSGSHYTFQYIIRHGTQGSSEEPKSTLKSESLMPHIRPCQICLCRTLPYAMLSQGLTCWKDPGHNYTFRQASMNDFFPLQIHDRRTQLYQIYADHTL